jgi:hypothetical protein
MPLLPVAFGAGVIVYFTAEREPVWWVAAALAAAAMAVAFGLRTRPVLDQRRSRGTGPPFCRIGRRSIRYDAAALDAWMRERQFRCTQEYASSG